MSAAYKKYLNTVHGDDSRRAALPCAYSLDLSRVYLPLCARSAQFCHELYKSAKHRIHRGDPFTPLSCGAIQESVILKRGCKVAKKEQTPERRSPLSSLPLPSPKPYTTPSSHNRSNTTSPPSLYSPPAAQTWRQNPCSPQYDTPSVHSPSSPPPS
jgi:hypothetical protein